MDLNSLPEEIVVDIFTFLGAKELLRVCRVCKTWNYLICHEQLIWKAKCQEAWRMNLKLCSSQDWKAFWEHCAKFLQSGELNSLLKILWKTKTNHIQSLNVLSRLQLHALPAKFLGSLHHLKSLDLSENKIQFLPNEITKLKKLTKLYLDRNEISDLPTQFANLKYLETLTLSNNKLTEVPEAILSLVNLKILDLGSNRIQSMDQIPVRLPLLEVLRLENNQLKTVPPSISRLSSLETLSLSNNQLVTVPEEIGLLPKLECLWLNDNRLMTVPSSISKTPLRLLFINNNRLKFVPPAITSMRVGRLSTGHNPLDSSDMMVEDGTSPMEAVSDADIHSCCGAYNNSTRSSRKRCRSDD
mmetsp:Transcript_16832/g.23424  ORF Transcript_16832/g.23424 Transcript_16832/m.23424 type:complete len:357 (+) Transcript_16832:92-1162(+)